MDAEAAEAEVELALRLWSAAPACHGTTPTGRAIDQVLARVQSAEEVGP
jgi:hypothetical protein